MPQGWCVSKKRFVAWLVEHGVTTHPIASVDKATKLKLGASTLGNYEEFELHLRKSLGLTLVPFGNNERSVSSNIQGG